MSNTPITLGTLIEALEALDPEYVLPWGISAPHSYRGYYNCVAFERIGPMKAGAALATARSALNKTFEAYKGGNYAMRADTPAYLAHWGSVGVPLIGFGLIAGERAHT